MKMISLFIAASLTVACTAVPNVTEATTAEHPDARPYDETRDARVDVDLALQAAAETQKHAIIVMGANWCHDSRALAGWFETPRFQTLLNENYVVTYVDVGQKDRNIDIAQGFGLDDIVGTPTIIVTDSNGTVLNLNSAPTWRNAASRDEDGIYDYFENLAPSTTN